MGISKRSFLNSKLSFLVVFVPIIIIGIILGIIIKPDEVRTVSSTISKENKTKSWITDNEKEQIGFDVLREEQTKSEAMRKVEGQLEELGDTLDRFEEAKTVYEEFIDTAYRTLRNNGLSHEEAMKEIRKTQ